MLPAAFVVLDSFPLTMNGKIDRAALPAPVAERAGTQRAPSTPAEARVAAAWADVLGVADVSADDDFFALGGDSFAAVRAVRAIDPTLRVIDLFMHPTVEALGAFLDARDTAPASGLLHRLGGPPAGTTPTATLIGVPYGGGSAAAFGPLAAPLAQRGIAVVAVELPGHDPARPDEAPLALDELVDRLAQEIAERVSGPVAVYGHCVGSAVATALARRLEADGRTVLGVIAGGSFPAAPLPGRLSAWAGRVFGERWVSDRLYRDALKASGGVTDDMDEAATTVALRAMRHDAHEAQQWFGAQLEQGGPKLRAPLLCLVGERDRQTELAGERHREWGAFAERVELATIPRAGHYFLRHQAREVVEVLAGRLADWAAGRLPEPVRDVPVERGGLRRFYAVAAGQLVSNVGTALTAFALGVWAYQRSGRIIDLALIVMLAQLPAVLATPLGGALADRQDRRRIMLWCDAVSGLAMAGLVVLLATDRLALWSVLVVVGITSLVNAVQQPAWLAAISQLVPKPYLPQANALANLGRSLGNIVAPLAGGVLVTAVGLSAVVAIDVATFAIGVLTLLAVRFPDRLVRRREESFRASVSGGLRFIRRRRPLVVMVVFVAAANYFNAVLWVVTTPLVLSFTGPAGLGVVTAVGGAGAALGGVAVLVWGGTRRRATGMIAFVAGSGIGTILMGLWPSVAVVALGLAVRWGAMAIGNAHWLSLIQVKVGQELQGRVLAANLMLVTVMEPLGFLTASPLADAFGVGTLVVACGVFLTAWGLIGLRYRPLHHMEDALPDAVPDAEVDADLDRLQARMDLAWAR
jgi:surfactin synthase thioesterase subunit/MFS family permease